VVELLVPGKVEDGGEFPLQKALGLLKECDACEYEKGVAIICKTQSTRAQ
jgi:carboxymethylenebutenolidase